jgi:hypothetical protein
MKPCDRKDCEQVAAYEIREVGGRAKPHVLCMKHGLAKQAELSSALMAWQSTGIGPRLPSVEAQLEALKAENAALASGAPPAPATPAKAPELVIPAAGASNELELLRGVQVSQREALERAAGELTSARQQHAQLQTDLGMVTNRCRAVTQDRDDALSENTTLRAELAAAHERLKALEVQPLASVNANADSDAPPTKPD